MEGKEDCADTYSLPPSFSSSGVAAAAMMRCTLYAELAAKKQPLSSRTENEGFRGRRERERGRREGEEGVMNFDICFLLLLLSLSFLDGK